MPKYCIYCKETKSRGNFRKEQIGCKSCQPPTESPLSPTEVLLMKLDEVATKVDAISQMVHDTMVKVDTMDQMFYNKFQKMEKDIGILDISVNNLRKQSERKDAFQRIALTTIGSHKDG